MLSNIWMSLWWRSRAFSPMFLYQPSLIPVFSCSDHFTIYIHYLNSYYLKFYLRKLSLVFYSNSSVTLPSSSPSSHSLKFTGQLISLLVTSATFATVLQRLSLVASRLHTWQGHLFCASVLPFISFPFTFCTLSDIPLLSIIRVVKSTLSFFIITLFCGSKSFSKLLREVCIWQRVSELLITWKSLFRPHTWLITWYTILSSKPWAQSWLFSISSTFLDWYWISWTNLLWHLYFFLYLSPWLFAVCSGNTFSILWNSWFIGHPFLSHSGHHTHHSLGLSWVLFLMDPIKLLTHNGDSNYGDNRHRCHYF